MLHPRGTALRIAYNEHVARFSDEAAPHLLVRFQGHSRGERPLLDRLVWALVILMPLSRISRALSTNAFIVTLIEGIQPLFRDQVFNASGRVFDVVPSLEVIQHYIFYNLLV